MYNKSHINMQCLNINIYMAVFNNVSVKVQVIPWMYLNLFWF